MRPPEPRVVQCRADFDNRTGTGAQSTALPCPLNTRRMFDPSPGSAPFGSPAQRVIVIVGGGFCGTVLAIRLLRELQEPLRIVIVEPRAELGAGVAYATRDYPYPLNVAAGQMSLDSTNPGDFLEFACGQGIHADAVDYLPRQVYGEYLRARLAAARAAAPGSELAHHQARALRLQPAAQDDAKGGWELWLDNGRTLRAHDVVLALGNPPPAPLPGRGTGRANGALIEDPWTLGHAGEPHSVLVVGSGLTMIDAALRLAALRPRVRRIHVLSRHGWLPQPQAASALPLRRPDVRAALDDAGGSARRIVGAIRRLTQQVSAAGGDWREVVTTLRGQLPALWRTLDGPQRARLLRHARSLWDVHRHRVPTGPLNAVRMLERCGVLEVHAGRIVELNPAVDGVEVIWRPRGAARTRAWLVDRVVNCSGPGKVETSGDPFVKSLLANGLIRVDALGLGIDVAVDGRVIGRDGAPVDGLHYLGPWLRARDWEATAVPELRDHAAALARRLSAHRGALAA
jgi:uncharacterized NAD(P)/FAD-binding protein YdhS